MGNALVLINGIPRMSPISGTGANVYDDVTVVGVGGISAGTEVTLPDNGTYEGIDLEVFLEGQFLEPGLDYNYVGSGTSKTKVTFTEDLDEGDRIHWRVEGVATQIYDEVEVISGTINTGDPITLPDGQDFGGSDLEVYLNGQYLEPVADYNYVGTAPYTQIAMTFDLDEPDRLRFRMDT